MAEILVIKLSALGDFVQAFKPFAAIRAHHPADRITLLTTQPYADLGRACPWFDDVMVDERPRLYQLRKVFWLAQALRRPRFKMVYDLQTSSRSSWYSRLMLRMDCGPDWSGIARGCSHPHANPERNHMHTVERQAEQLRMAGINEQPAPDLEWLDGDLSHLGIPSRFAVLIPGGSPHRPDKRWPDGHFADLAVNLNARGLTPVVVGTRHESAAAKTITAACPAARDITGRTGLFELGALARKAACAVGNDTGPMHLMASVGCPSLALYSHASDPNLCGQRGPRVRIMRVDDLSKLEVATVTDAVFALPPR